MQILHASATTPNILAASDSSVGSAVEDAISGVFDPLTDFISGLIFAEVTVFGVTFPWIVAWLVIAGAVFSVYFGAVQLRGFRHAVSLVRASSRRKGAAGEPGEVTPFRALTAAVSGTVGLGNIAGVAVAVTIGGPGATFWMVLCGLLGMAIKFTECTLGVKYREVDEDGTVRGGPLQYLRRGLADRGMAWLGRLLAPVFAVIIVIFAVLGGNMFQINQSLAQLRTVTGGDTGWLGGPGAGLVFGLVASVLIAAVLLGGMRTIGAVTARLVPAMAAVYIGACLVVITANIGSVPRALASVVEGAFQPSGVAGGFVGVMVVGFQRAAFSNEAGLGSAPMAHAAVRTRHPVTEGFVAMLGPFIDTVIVCTVTALTIIIARPQSWLDAREAVANGEAAPGGVALTSDAFATVMPWFPYVLTVAVVLFAFSTIITWTYYGEQGWADLFGRSRTSLALYKLLVSACAVAGALLTLGAVLDLADALVFVLALFNVIGLYLMAPIVKRELASYRAHLRGRAAREADGAGGRTPATTGNRDKGDKGGRG
ncbi:alanine/glycine:cation symporter family protein [Streptomyces sp. IBSNAI002]|uniref:alanine/glycine:cation symporter family protein n=1 Tax=Streptomyces sp. IBSNAI002 TaxID=3457500 RepID=UPI003FD2119E